MNFSCGFQNQNCTSVIVFPLSSLQADTSASARILEVILPRKICRLEDQQMQRLQVSWFSGRSSGFTFWDFLPLSSFWRAPFHFHGSCVKHRSVIWCWSPALLWACPVQCGSIAHAIILVKLQWRIQRVEPPFLLDTIVNLTYWFFVTPSSVWSSALALACQFSLTIYSLCSSRWMQWRNLFISKKLSGRAS